MKALGDVTAMYRLVEVLPEATLLLSADGRVLAANRPASDMLGLSVQQLRGKSLHDLTLEPPEDVEQRLGVWSGTRTPVPGSLSLIAAGGRIIDCRCDGALVRPQTGNATAVVFLRCVPEAASNDGSLTPGGEQQGEHGRASRTEERLEELVRERTARLERHVEELRESGERLHALIRNSSDVIAVVGADGAITYVSPSVERVLGYEPEALIGTDSFSLIHPDDVPAARGMFAELLRSSGTNLSAEVRGRHSDGRWRCLEVSAADLSNEPSVAGIVASCRDVTERKEAEEKLRESQERHRLITRATNEVIWDHDLKTGRQEWNGAIQAVFGYLPEEVGDDARWWEERVHPEDRARVLSRVDAVLDGGEEAWSNEYRFCRGDGTYAAVLDRGCVVRDGRGRPLRLLGSMMDVTDRKRAEDALRESEERYRLVTRATNEVIWDSDMRTDTQVWDGAIKDMFGYPPHQVTDTDWWEERIHPDDRKRVTSSIRAVLRSGGEVWSEEYRFRRADGGYSVVADRAYVVRGAGGEPVRVVGSMADVSERRRAEEERDRLASIVESSDYAVVGGTPEGTVASWNSGAEKLYGYSAEEIRGRPISTLVPPDRGRELSDALEKAMQGQSAYRDETVHLTREGWRVHVSVTVSPIRDTRGNVVGVSAISQNITERKLAEAARRKSEARIRAIVDTAPDAIVTMTTDGLVRSFNQGAERMFGYAAEEIVRQPLRMLMPDRFRAAHEAGFRRYLETGEARMVGKGPVELAGLRRDGTVFPLELSLGETREGEEVLFTGFIRDITERKRMEDELRESEGRFRAQYKGLPIPTTSWKKTADGDFVLVDYNDAALESSRGNASDLLGKRASEVYSGRPEMLERFSRCADERTALRTETWHTRVTTGENRYVVMHFAFVPPELVMLHIEDVTGRRLAELEKQRFASLVENSHEFVGIAEFGGNVTFVNEAGLRMVGLDDIEEARRTRPEDYLAAEDRGLFDELMLSVAEKGFWSGELRFRHFKTGRTIPVMNETFRVNDPETGEPINLATVSRDISERKRAEAEIRQLNERLEKRVRERTARLRASEAELRALFEAMEDVILVLDAQGRYLKVAPTNPSLLYRPSEDMIGRTVHEVLPREQADVLLGHIGQALKTRESVEFEYSLPIDGGEVWFSAVVAPMTEDSVVVVSRDTTERKQMEANQQRFLANAAHQLRTPITAVLGAAELLATRKSMEPEVRDRLLGHISTEGSRMQRLADTLLRMARLGRDLREPDLGAINAGEAIRQAAERMEPVAQGAGIALRVEDHGAVCVRADAEWLQEALLVLLSNAAIHSEGGASIRLRERPCYHRGRRGGGHRPGGSPPRVRALLPGEGQLRRFRSGAVHLQGAYRAHGG